jgi:hypothetical protein
VCQDEKSKNEVPNTLPLNKGRKKPEENVKNKVENKQTSETNKLQQLNFIIEFCEDINEYLSTELNHININSEQEEVIKLFLEVLKNEGIAILRDSEEIGQEMCISSIQTAIECLLLDKLNRGDITSLDIYFLNSLPCLPLRTPLPKDGANKEMESKECIEGIRAQTVRQLRENGANLNISYCSQDYKLLHAAEFETYELEKQKPNTRDIPLATSILEKRQGNLYIFTDKKGNTYQILIQDRISQQDAEQEKKWKICFGAKGNNGKIDNRCRGIVQFIDHHR